MKYFYKLIWWIFGWKIVGDVPWNVKKYIIIVAPHTSNLDFIIGEEVVSLESSLRKKSEVKEIYGALNRPYMVCIFCVEDAEGRQGARKEQHSWDLACPTGWKPDESPAGRPSGHTGGEGGGTQSVS